MPLNPNLIAHPTADQIEAAYRKAHYLQDSRNLSDLEMLKNICTNRDLSEDDYMNASTWAKHRKKIPKYIKKLGFWHALLSFLEENNLSEDEEPPVIYGDQLAKYFGAREGSRSSGMLDDIAGNFQYFQKSSWYPGLIQTAYMEVKKPKGRHNFVEINEEQKSGPYVREKWGYAETAEYFEGIAIARQNLFFFLMRSDELNIPKFIMIYKAVHGPDKKKGFSALYGQTLKGTRSTMKRYHISPVVMKRVEERPAVEGALSEQMCREHFEDEWRFFFQNDELL